MTIEFRPVVESRFDEFLDAESHSYSSPPLTDDKTAFREVFDFDRSIAAFDGNRIVGGACYFRLGLSVPGAEIPAGGVTFVFVLPTHRRRGVVTGLMRRQLAQMRDEDIAAGALHAAESSIYGRFGYGPAVPTEVLSIERPYSAFRSPVSPAGEFRFVSDSEALTTFPRIYEECRSITPGLFARDEGWWRLRLRARGRAGGSPGWQKVVYEREDEPAAYAVYSLSDDWQGAIYRSTLQVVEMAHVDPEAYAAMWSYLVGVDLVQTVRAFSGPEPPLWWMLADPRRLRREVRDGLWLRLVDVPAVLSARRYSADGVLNIAVSDDFLPGSSGTYRLEVSGGEASCEVAKDGVAADVALAASELASCYFGATSFSALGTASMAEELSTGAFSRANAMFTWHRPPMTSAPEPLT